MTVLRLFESVRRVGKPGLAIVWDGSMGLGWKEALGGGTERV